MKKFLILCVVLVARIHAESRTGELNKDNEDYDSDEDNYDPDYVVEAMDAQHQQEVETYDVENKDVETEDVEADDVENKDVENEDVEAEDVETKEEDNEVLSFFTKQYDQVVDACRMETAYTDEVVTKEKASYFSENRGLRVFNYCFLEKVGLVSRDGKLNIDNVHSKVSYSFPETFKKCFKRQKKYPVSFFVQCFHWQALLYMRLKEFENVIRSFAENPTPIVDACRMETGYTDEVIAEEEKSGLNNDAGLKKFNNCFLEKTGFGGDEKFDIDTALTKKDVVYPQNKVTEIIEICKSKTIKKIIPDSVPFLSACLHLGVSNYFRSVRWEKFSVLPEAEHVTRILDSCRMETGFTDVVLHKEEEDNFTEEEGLRKFNNCFLEKTGVITSDGKLNIDAALAKLPPSFAKPIIEHCQFVSHLPMEYDQVVNVCRMETGYTGEVFAEEEASYFSENRGLKKFNYCFLEKTGFVTSDGKLNVRDALDRLAPIYTKDILEYCKGREKKHPGHFFQLCYGEVQQQNNKQLLLIKYVVQFINEHFTQIVNVCRTETGYTDEVIAEEEKSNLKEDAGLKKFNTCFLEKTGFIIYETFNIDTVLEMIPQNNVTKIVEHCQSLTTKKIIPDSVPFFSGCLHLGVSEYVRKYGFRHVIQQESDQVLEMVYDCQRQTGFTYDVIKKSFTDDNFNGDERLGKFNDCFIKKIGLVTSDGKLNIDVFLAKHPHSFAKAIVQLCQTKNILKNTTESVRDFSTCYHHGVEDYISVAARSGFTAFFTSFGFYVPGTYFDKILTF